MRHADEITDLFARYAGSALGIAWTDRIMAAGLKPAAQH